MPIGPVECKISPSKLKGQVVHFGLIKLLKKIKWDMTNLTDHNICSTTSTHWQKKVIRPNYRLVGGVTQLQSLEQANHVSFI